MAIADDIKTAYNELVSVFFDMEYNFTTTLDDDLLVDSYAEFLKRVVNYKAISFLRYNIEKKTYLVLKEINYNKEFKSARLKIIRDGIIEWSGKNGKPFIFEDKDQDNLTKIIVPIMHFDELVGAIIIYSNDDINYFDQNRVKILQIMAKKLSLAYENRNLYKSLERRNARLKDLKEYLDNLIKNMTDGIIVMDENGVIKVFNREIEKIFNKSYKHFLGKRLNTALGDKEFADKLLRTCAKVEDNELITKEIELKREDNVIIPLKVSFKNIHQNDNLNGKLMVFNNLLATKELEELKRVDKLKDEFLSMVSHELRTPLTSINAYVETLLDMSEEQSYEREFLEIIDIESGRLSRLINDILDLSKIEAGKMDFHFEKYSINNLIKHSIKNMESYAKKRLVSLELDLDENIKEITIDNDRIMQVLLNLISNAVKFSNENEKVIIKSNLENRFVKISVIDSGIGISEEFMPIVFEKFKQVQGVLKRSSGGTGLGLPICKNIVESHSGKIWVESKIGKGSKFIFTLPNI